MVLDRLSVPRRRGVSKKKRCHPLVLAGDVELDQALLKMHSVQEMGEFWECAKRTLHVAFPLHFMVLR